MTDIGPTHTLALECSRSKIRMDDIEWFNSSNDAFMSRSVLPSFWSDGDVDCGWCAVLTESGVSSVMAGRSGAWRGSSHFRMLLCDLHRAAFTKHADCMDDTYVANADCSVLTPAHVTSFIPSSTTRTPFLSPSSSVLATASPPSWTWTETETFECSLRAAVQSKYAATYLISAEYRSLSRKRIWEGNIVIVRVLLLMRLTSYACVSCKTQSHWVTCPS